MFGLKQKQTLTTIVIRLCEIIDANYYYYYLVTLSIRCDLKYYNIIISIIINYIFLCSHVLKVMYMAYGPPCHHQIILNGPTWVRRKLQT